MWKLFFLYMYILRRGAFLNTGCPITDLPTQLHKFIPFFKIVKIIIVAYSTPSDCGRWLGIHVTPSEGHNSSYMYRAVIGEYLLRNVALK